MNHERGFYGLLGFILGVVLMAMGSSGMKHDCLTTTAPPNLALPHYSQQNLKDDGILRGPGVCQKDSNGAPCQ